MNEKGAKLANISKGLGRRRLESLRKETAMKTFRQTTVAFSESLAQLKRLEGPGRITQALRVVKERDTGKLCYQAEEDLPQAELS